MSTGSAKDKGSSIMILDHQAMKGLTLAPEQKLATTIDLSKIKKPAGPSNPFEMVRQLVREGSSSLGEKVEPLGKKEIDGRVAVGFRTHNNMADQAFWADPQTARLVRVEFDFPGGSGHGVMSNFRYDMELDPSLFSLEPPAGYTVNNMEVKMPVEDDLVNTLRLIAEHNDGTFPAAIGMSNREFQQAIQAASMSETQKLMQEPETAKLLKDLQAQYGKDKDGFMKAWMKAPMPFTQKLTQKYMQGMMFYNMLTSAERLALRRRRRKAGHTRSAHLLVQAHGGREVPGDLCRSQRQRGGSRRDKDFPEDAGGQHGANDEHQRVRSEREGLDRNASRLCRRAEWPAAADP